MSKSSDVNIWFCHHPRTPSLALRCIIVVSALKAAMTFAVICDFQSRLFCKGHSVFMFTAVPAGQKESCIPTHSLKGCVS